MSADNDLLEYQILAPHVDDEMIGCYTKLLTGHVSGVHYFFDLTEERQQEAIRASQFYGFLLTFSHAPDAMLSMMSLDNAIHRIMRQYHTANTIWLVPDITDVHHHHKMVNWTARKVAHRLTAGGASKVQLEFYSIDMSSPSVVPLPSHIASQKKEALLQNYPSQFSLFQNEKYFLFEGYSRDNTRSAARLTRYVHVVLSSYPDTDRKITSGIYIDAEVSLKDWGLLSELEANLDAVLRQSSVKLSEYGRAVTIPNLRYIVEEIHPELLFSLPLGQVESLKVTARAEDGSSWSVSV
jgi:LmbE family N-acetylglucosaminyl deacetylase